MACLIHRRNSEPAVFSHRQRMQPGPSGRRRRPIEAAASGHGAAARFRSHQQRLKAEHGARIEAIIAPFPPQMGTAFAARRSTRRAASTFIEARDSTMNPRVGVIMGSKSDWSTLSHTATMLEQLGIPFEVRVVSAHRTPDLLFEYAAQADSRGIEVIIAGAGGAAHLPGMCAAKTHLPVLGVPVQSAVLNGVDSLLSIVQMPAGIPVATLAIGKAGAINAALLAASILGNKYPDYARRLQDFRAEQTRAVLDNPDPRPQEEPSV